jgi:hypothetical protein
MLETSRKANRIKLVLGGAMLVTVVSLQALAQCPNGSELVRVERTGDEEHTFCRCLPGYIARDRQCVPGPTPKPTTATGPAPVTTDNAKSKILKFVADYEKQVGFRSPLNDAHLAEVIVSESERSGVPVWLMLAQAQRETNMGRPINGTVADGRRFTDGVVGNAHNLFNVRPGDSWTGRVLDLGKGSGKFRVYDSYEDSIKDYAQKLSTNYRGLTLDQLVNRYFPANDNGGQASVEAYIQFLIKNAASQGVVVSRESVPIGAK